MELRDELARDIFLADNARAPESMMLADWEVLKKRASGETYAHPIADGLIAKGYRNVRCTGAPSCGASLHTHGCFGDSDESRCDTPADHEAAK